MTHRLTAALLACVGLVTTLAGCSLLGRETVHSVNELIDSTPGISGSAHSTLGTEGATRIVTEVEVSRAIQPSILNSFMASYEQIDWSGKETRLYLTVAEDGETISMEGMPRPDALWPLLFEIAADFPEQNVILESSNALTIDGSPETIIPQLHASFTRGAPYTRANLYYAPKDMTITFAFTPGRALGAQWAAEQRHRLDTWWEQSRRLDPRLALYYRSDSSPDRYTVITTGPIIGETVEDVTPRQDFSPDGFVPDFVNMPPAIAADVCRSVAAAGGESAQPISPVYCGSEYERFPYYWLLDGDHLGDLMPLYRHDAPALLPGRLPVRPGSSATPQDIPGAASEDEAYTPDYESVQLPLCKIPRNDPQCITP